MSEVKHVFTVKLDKATAAKLARLAAAAERSRGDVVRRLILAGTIDPAQPPEPVKVAHVAA